MSSTTACTRWWAASPTPAPTSAPTPAPTLANLVGLDLANNGLTGPLPAELALLPLRALRLGGNALTGHAPPALWPLLSQMEKLELEGSGVTGCLMQECFRLCVRKADVTSVAPSTVCPPLALGAAVDDELDPDPGTQSSRCALPAFFGVLLAWRA